MKKKHLETEDEIVKKFLDQIPNNINIGSIQSNFLWNHPLKLFNPSRNTTLHVNFSDCIFVFQPSELTLKPRESAVTKAFIYLTEAKILIGKISVTVNRRFNKVVKISAVGKFPFLKINKRFLNFGNVNLGNELVDHLEIDNLSQIAVSFRVKSALESDSVPSKEHSQSINIDGNSHPSKIIMAMKRRESNSHLTISPCKGSLKPGEKFQLKVKYHPKVFDQHDFNEYIVDVSQENLTEEEESIKAKCIEKWNQNIISMHQPIVENNSMMDFDVNKTPEDYLYDVDETSSKDFKQRVIERQGIIYKQTYTNFRSRTYRRGKTKCRKQNPNF